MKDIHVILLGKIGLVLYCILMTFGMLSVLAEGSLILAAIVFCSLLICRELWLFLRHHENRLNQENL